MAKLAKPLLLFLFGTLSLHLDAKFPKKDNQDCSPKFAALLDRTYHSDETLRAAVEKSFSDPLIRDLELQHLRAVRAFDSNGRITWKQFSPNWVFQDPDTLEKILDYFDPHDSAASSGYAGTVHEWLREWESGYEKNFGKIAKSWTDRDRRVFLQRLLVEGAVG